jgi:MFS transporter, SP family, general alpha glucoside:H+ symporter
METDPTTDDAKPGAVVSKPGAADPMMVEAIQREHELSFMEALRLYPSAVAWSAFVSIGVIMLAFDPQLIGNLYATPQFERDFGYEFDGSVRPHLAYVLALEASPIC